MKKRIIIFGNFMAFTAICLSQTIWTGTATTGNAYRSGNVGIGTATAPTKALEIKTSTANDGILITQTSSGHSTFRLDNTSTSGHKYGFCSSGNGSQEGSGHFILYDYTDNRYNLFISGGGSGQPTAGFMGIGTIAPTAKLDIAGNMRVSANTYADPAIEIMTASYSRFKTFGTGQTFMGTFSTPANNFNLDGSILTIGQGNALNKALNIVNNTNASAPTDFFTVWGSGKTEIKTGDATPLSISGGAGSSAYEYRMKQTTGNVGSWILNYYKSYGFGEDNTGVGHIWSDVYNSYKLINFQTNTSLYNTAQVWIGNKTPLSPHNDFMFAVEGKVVVQSLYVTAMSAWADYVFADDYKLPKLYDIEAYYKANKHLPEIPSAKEVAEKGIDVGEMNTLLLKKIEELTIHMVEQQKQIDELKSKVK